jgi:hypothetical protein
MTPYDDAGELTPKHDFKGANSECFELLVGRSQHDSFFVPAYFSKEESMQPIRPARRLH